MSDGIADPNTYVDALKFFGAACLLTGIVVRRKKLRYYKDMATIAERLIRTARKLGPYYGADKKFLRLDPLFNHVVMGEGALGDIEKILVKTVWPEEAPRA